MPKLDKYEVCFPPLIFHVWNLIFHLITYTWTQIKNNIHWFLFIILERDTLIREKQEKHREMHRLKLEISLQANHRLVRLLLNSYMGFTSLYFICIKASKLVNNYTYNSLCLVWYDGTAWTPKNYRREERWQKTKTIQHVTAANCQY